MDRTAVLWTLTVFFGASLLFRVLNQATAGSPAGVRVAVQVGALAVVLAAVVLFVRWRGRRR